MINAWCRWCMLLLINMTLKKINILEYAFGEGGHQKAYAVYAFINVDNCERPLSRPRFGKINFFNLSKDCRMQENVERNGKFTKNTFLECLE